MNAGQSERNVGRPVAAFVLIALGIFFLVAQVVDLGDILGFLWPFFVILPGAAFLFAAYRGGRSDAGFAIPGMVVTGTGLILLYQNITNHWESWAYAWALYPVFVGMGLSFMGRRRQNDREVQNGEGMIRWGGIVFIALAGIFELLIFRQGGALSNLLAPLALIGLGVYLLMNKRTAPVKVNSAGRRNWVTVGPATNGEKPKRDERSQLQKDIDAALAEDEPEER
jgi:hypothetical protein